MDLKSFLACFAISLLNSGSVFSTKVLNGTFGRLIYFYESISDEKLLLQWSFKNSPIASRIPGFSPGCIPAYTGRCQLYDNGTLRLDNLTSTDEGTYSFTAQEVPSTLIKESIYELTVYSELRGAVLSSNGTDGHFISGTYVSLHCDAGSQTVTNYIFYHNGKSICFDQHVTCQGAYLYFQPVTKSDNGIFTCTIQNPVSSNTSNILQLTVSGPPEGHIACLVEADSPYMKLTCSWPGGQPGANVTMVFNGVTETGLNQVTIRFPANTYVQEPTMMCYGDYFGKTSNCEHKFEPPQSPGHNNRTVTSVIEGQAAVMKVDLVSGMYAVFTWYRLTPELTPIHNTDKFTVISNSFMSLLQITDVTTKDVGEYECKATNFVGNQSFLFTVHVTGECVTASCHGLGGGEVAGIVIGVVAGIIIIEVTVFFILKAKKKIPNGTVYENSTAHIYSTTIPGTELKPTQQESHYEQLTQKPAGIYSNLGPSTRK